MRLCLLDLCDSSERAFQYNLSAFGGGPGLRATRSVSVFVCVFSVSIGSEVRVGIRALTASRDGFTLVYVYAEVCSTGAESLSNFTAS